MVKRCAGRCALPAERCRVLRGQSMSSTPCHGLGVVVGIDW